MEEKKEVGLEFERCILSFLRIFYNSVYDEDGFSKTFNIKDRIVDMCIFYKKKIFLIQTKTTVCGRIRKRGEIIPRLQRVASILQEFFPSHTIKCLVLVLQQRGSSQKPESGWLYSKKTSYLLILLKNCLMSNGYLTEKEFESVSKDFHDLISSYRALETDENVGRTCYDVLLEFEKVKIF